MISLNDENAVNSLFERKIAPHLDNLEQQRIDVVTTTNRLWKKILVTVVLPPTLIVAAICYYLFDLSNFGTILAAAFVAVILGVKGHEHAYSSSKEFESDRRDRFMSLVCEAIGDLTYNHNGSAFNLWEFREHNLIPDYDKADLEDALQGVHRGYNFSMTEATVFKEKNSWDDEGNTISTVFRGIVIKLDSPLTVHATILVTRERGKILNKITGAFKAGKRVNIPDTDFEAIYAVYASDVETTRKLFTPSLIKLLKKLPEILDAQVELSFDYGKILITAKDAKPFLNRFSIEMDTNHYRRFFVDVVRECTLAINLIDEFYKVNENISAAPEQTPVTF